MIVLVLHETEGPTKQPINRWTDVVENIGGRGDFAVLKLVADSNCMMEIRHA